MGRYCPSHRGRISVLPPRSLLDPLIEVDTSIGQHWYWLGEDDWEDPVDNAHYAVFKWAAPAEHVTSWMVARLLWCWQNNGFAIKRLTLVNTCGLTRCINPDHWRYTPPLSQRKFKLPDENGVRAMRYEKTYVSPGSVHIIPSDVGYGMCGVAANALVEVKDAVITCSDCVKEWFEVYGRPLIEVT